MNSPLKDEFKLACYTSEQIPDVWPVYKPLIQKALDRGSVYDIVDIHFGLLSKKMQLWAWADEACLVTSIQTELGQKFCLLITLAGTGMSEWFQYLPLVEDWARQQGAEQMRVYGRVGWARQTGYDIEYCKLVKTL